MFDARTTFGGLTVEGLVAGGAADRVEILVDGRPLRSLRTSLTGGPPHFQLEIKRAALDHFPKETTIEVRLPDHTPLLTVAGAQRLHLSVPHGDGTLPGRLAAGCRLDKKGNLGPTPRELSLRHDRYLELYARARDFFEEELGRDLFLLYGTLLGYHRNGDLIPGDDDFDVGYVSHRTDPVAVKEETKRVILRLVRAGFTVSFNRKGRLFRLQWRDDPDDLHLDVRPVWFQDGRVWLHNHCSFPASPDDFLPTEEGKLRGVAVRVPRDTEKFLLAHYGPTWRMPDPGFTYHPAEVDPAVAGHLAKALISAKEYRELAERVHRERQRSAGAGRLVSIGSLSLYPLERFIP
ncbi:MAG: LicD family protein [Micromonosporaceae bacterium]